MGAQRLDLLELNSAGTSATRSAVGSLPGARYRMLVQGPDAALSFDFQKKPSHCASPSHVTFPGALARHAA